MQTVSDLTLLKKLYYHLPKLDQTQWPKAYVTAMFPLIGKQYPQNRELLVVGRALNSWGTKGNNIWWSRSETLTATQIENLIDYSQESGEKCPMQWIMDGWEEKKEGIRRMNTSAFWRVTKAVLEELTAQELVKTNDDWASHLAWTELYKITYAEGGNPDTPLFNLQYQWALAAFHLELLLLQPKRVLLLTGYEWAKDFIPLPSGTRIKEDRPVQWAGSWNGIPMVIAKHPQGKPEDEMVKEIVEGFAV